VESCPAASPLQAMSFAQRLAKKADEFEARKKAEEQKRDAEEAAKIHAWVSGWQKKDNIFASIKNNKTLEKNAEFDKCKLKGHLFIFCVSLSCVHSLLKYGPSNLWIGCGSGKQSIVPFCSQHDGIQGCERAGSNQGSMRQSQ